MWSTLLTPNLVLPIFVRFSIALSLINLLIVYATLSVRHKEQKKYHQFFYNKLFDTLLKTTKKIYREGAYIEIFVYTGIYIENWNKRAKNINKLQSSLLSCQCLGLSVNFVICIPKKSNISIYTHHSKKHLEPSTSVGPKPSHPWPMPKVGLVYVFWSWHKLLRANYIAFLNSWLPRLLFWNHCHNI